MSASDFSFAVIRAGAFIAYGNGGEAPTLGYVCTWTGDSKAGEMSAATVVETSITDAWRSSWIDDKCNSDLEYDGSLQSKT